jgi:hypothetical protein
MKKQLFLNLEDINNPKIEIVEITIKKAKRKFDRIQHQLNAKEVPSIKDLKWYWKNFDKFNK